MSGCSSDCVNRRVRTYQERFCFGFARLGLGIEGAACRQGNISIGLLRSRDRPIRGYSRGG